MDLEQEFEKETGFEVYDKTNVKYNGAYVEWLESRIEQLTIGGVSHLLIAWEQYKKANWWESESVDVEKYLMEQFKAIYCG